MVSGLTFFFTVLSIANSTKLNCQLDLMLLEGVRWFGGLTCDFWAEKGKRKRRTAGKAMDSVISRLASTRAEAPLNLKGKSNGTGSFLIGRRERTTAKAKANAGILRSAQNDRLNALRKNALRMTGKMARS